MTRGTVVALEAAARRAAVRRLKAAGARLRAFLAATWLELLTAAALLVGWGLLTHGIASLTTPAVWPISGGLLCLSLFGWRFLFTIARDGMYDLLTRRQ